MTALLDERQKRRREQRDERPDDVHTKSNGPHTSDSKSLESLVESVKRKSANIDPPGQGKRRKL